MRARLAVSAENVEESTSSNPVLSVFTKISATMSNFIHVVLPRTLKMLRLFSVYVLFFHVIYMFSPAKYTY